MERSYFKEEQKFDQVWFRLLIMLSWVPLVVIFGIGIHQQIVLNKPWGDNPVSDTGLIVMTVIIFVVMAVVTWLAFSLRLVTEVTSEGFRYCFPPLMPKSRMMQKGVIAEYEVKRYNPILDYGGWGLRAGISGKGRAYNVKGNMGLLLKLHNGKKILFGTQRPEALKAAMDKMMNPTEF